MLNCRDSHIAPQRKKRQVNKQKYHFHSEVLLFLTISTEFVFHISGLDFFSYSLLFSFMDFYFSSRKQKSEKSDNIVKRGNVGNILPIGAIDHFDDELWVET